MPHLICQCEGGLSCGGPERNIPAQNAASDSPTCELCLHPLVNSRLRLTGKWSDGFVVEDYDSHTRTRAPAQGVLLRIRSIRKKIPVVQARTFQGPLQQGGLRCLQRLCLSLFFCECALNQPRWIRDFFRTFGIFTDDRFYGFSSTMRS